MYQSLHTTVVGPGRRSARDSDSHARDASHERVRHRGALALQRRRQARRRSSTSSRGCARCSSGRTTCAIRARSWRISSSISSRIKFSSSRRRATSSRFPSAATPLDFAYQVHTDVGNHCVGAKVNGKIVPLDYQLKNGDICEVLVNKSSRPSLDWLSIVKTSGAKHKIKQWFRKERKEENVVLGQEAVEHELAREHMRTDLARGEVIEKIAKRMNYTSATDLFAAIGFGDASAARSSTQLKDEVKTDEPRRSRRAARGPRRRGASRATRAASASRASTTSSCGSRSAAARCRAIRSWGTSRSARASPCIAPIARTSRT